MQSTTQTLTIPNITGSDTLATLAISNIFTGANTFKDGTSFSIVGSSDSTKELQFNVSSNTTGKVLTISTSQTTSQTLNVPNITGTDTLPTLGLSNTFTGATNTFVTLLTTSAVTSLTSAAATNLLIRPGSGGNIYLEDSTDSSKNLTFNISGSSTSTITTIATSSTGSQTWTIPNNTSSDTFAGLGKGQTFSGSNIFSSALTISAVTNQLILGVTHTTTITAPAPSASRVDTIPDVGGPGSFLMNGWAGSANTSQATSNTTAVTLNVPIGAISMFGTVNANTTNSFTFTNSYILNNATVIVWCNNTLSTTSFIPPTVTVSSVTAGSCSISVKNSDSSHATAAAPIIYFSICV